MSVANAKETACNINRRPRSFFRQGENEYMIGTAVVHRAAIVRTMRIHVLRALRSRVIFFSSRANDDRF
jgi:hypothetical protein